MKTGRACDWYHAQPYGPPSQFATLQELRSFKFFCEKTSLELSSYYDDVRNLEDDQGLSNNSDFCIVILDKAGNSN